MNIIKRKKEWLVLARGTSGFVLLSIKADGCEECPGASLTLYNGKHHPFGDRRSANNTVAHFHHGQWAWWGDVDSFESLPDGFFDKAVELEDPDHYGENK